ncbi:dynein regulatory complex protein 1 [Pagrus major]|uniref:dynein regulatory complex protein 1 n=1 Tax=Pagrus major TaxID=143350 RepID=UPI003CC8B431
MEEVEKDPEEASEPSVLSENQEAKSGVSTQEAEEDPTEVKEESRESRPEEEEEVEESEKRIIDLQRDLSTLVTNIQTAADGKESMRRTELEEARRLRLERLENDVKSSQERFEEITRGWSIAKQKVIPQELQEDLNNQQELWAVLLEDKKKLINDLQQELKAGDDRYVKDLRKQVEELDLMMERMEDQIKTLTKAYREELAQMEVERLTQRKEKVEEYEATIHNLILETSDKDSIVWTEQNEKFQVLERGLQQMKGASMVAKLKEIKQEDDLSRNKFNLVHMKSRIISLGTDMRNLVDKYRTQEKQFTKRSRYLSDDYKRNVQQYECIQKKIKHFAAADVKKFEDMWLMIEAEVKQLVERVLVIESLIYKQHLGLVWERPPMPFMEHSGPIQPQKQAWRPDRQAKSQSFQTGSQRMTDASVGPQLEAYTESTDMETYKEGRVAQSESGAEVEEGKLTTETVKEVMELLCDEAGFLVEEKLLSLLAPLEKEEQTVVKLASLLTSFGIEQEDLPKLAHFLIKSKHQQREQTEVRKETDATNLTSELIDPKHVVPALKYFLEQLTRKSSACQHFSFQHVETRDASEDEAYWESMGNVIPEDKLKLWDAAENTLTQYHAVLTEISDLVPETESLEQQNKELRMVLQQYINTKLIVKTGRFGANDNSVIGETHNHKQRLEHK